MLCNYWMQKRDENRFYADPEMRIILAGASDRVREKGKKNKKLWPNESSPSYCSNVIQCKGKIGKD